MEALEYSFWNSYFYLSIICFYTLSWYVRVVIVARLMNEWYRRLKTRVGQSNIGPNHIPSSCKLQLNTIQTSRLNIQLISGQIMKVQV